MVAYAATLSVRHLNPHNLLPSLTVDFTRVLEVAAGIAEASVMAIERGVLPQIDTVERIAVALGTDPGWLGFGF